MSESLQTAPSKPWGIIATALWALGSLAVFIGMVLLLGSDLGQGPGTFLGVQRRGKSRRGGRAAGGQCVGRQTNPGTAAAKYRLARPDSNGQTAAGGVL